MPPDRGRASRACVSCRKQKTRCYEPSLPGKACLRCERLHQKCSLTQVSEQIQDEEPSTLLSGTDARACTPKTRKFCILTFGYV
ncbi:hypothetical protein N7454_005374 [Penicillium verhagenii]|nr:hypothetical protein N7454_005374 [Penicillium verhagenii]